jgi:hypothetical protein
MPIVLKSGSLNLLEPSGPAKVYNGSALPYYKIPRTLDLKQDTVFQTQSHTFV